MSAEFILLRPPTYGVNTTKPWQYTATTIQNFITKAAKKNKIALFDSIDNDVRDH